MAGIVNRKTFHIRDAKVTVRSSSAWTMTDAETVRIKMIRTMGHEIDDNGKAVIRVTDIEAGRLGPFVLMLVNTESVEGSLGFNWPLPSAPGEELVKAYHELGNCLNVNEVELWVSTLEEVDLPPGDPDLFPEANPGEASRRKSS